MKHARAKLLFSLCAGSALLFGCAPLSTVGKSPLRPAKMSSDSVALDLFKVKHDIDDDALRNDLWKQLDEQEIDVETRRRLAEEGFRIGVAGSKLPAVLEKQMNLREQAADPDEAQATDLAETGDVEMRHLQLQAGKPAEILTSSVYPELSVFRRGADGVTGKPFQKAQGAFTLKTYPQSDGRVKVELTPEILYGDPQPQYREREGGFVFEMARNRETFDPLRIEAIISPGESVVLACDPDKAGGLGRNFFTLDEAGETRQKLLVIRLSHTQHDPLWNAAE